MPDDQLTPEMPLRTALIKEAHEQPLSGHPGCAKLCQLVQSRYYWPSQGKDIDRYRNNCHACKRSHVPPLGSDQPSLDPLMPETEGFVRLAAVMAALACLLAATVLAIVTSERRQR